MPTRFKLAHIWKYGWEQRGCLGVHCHPTFDIHLMGLICPLIGVGLLTWSPSPFMIRQSCEKQRRKNCIQFLTSSTTDFFFFATVLLVDILEFLMSKHNLLFHKEWTQNRNSQNQNKLVTRFGRQLLLFRLTLTNQKAVFTENKIKTHNS